MIFSVAVLSVSLSLDALFVGFAYGLEGTRVPLSSKLMICLFSILYSGVAVFAGSAVSRYLPAAVGRGIGAGILACIGISMIVKTLIKSRVPTESSADGDGGTIFKLIIRSLGITIQVLRNPSAGDVDRSGIIDMKESVLLGSALSIDAVGVGIGSALSGLSGWYIPFAVGLCQLLFLSCGLFAGGHVGVLKRLDEKYTSLVPGCLLILLSVLRFL